MTDERRKYLASISKEEHIIRFKIIEQKARIKDEKFWLNHVECNKEQIRQTCWRIYCIKTIIKSLKKRLLAPRIPLELNEVVFPCACSVCKYPLAEDSYCPCCGQKLR